MKRFLRKLFSKAGLLFFILLLAAAGYFYRGWFIEQYHHAKGMYYIYKGDNAYAHDNMEKRWITTEQGWNFIRSTMKLGLT